MIHLDHCRFTDLGDGRVEVRGSRHERTTPYCVKVEGARTDRLPRDQLRRRARPAVHCQLRVRSWRRCGAGGRACWSGRSGAQLYFHVYGRDGVMGPAEPVRRTASHELGILIEVVAPTQAEADALVSLTRSTLLHYGYPGRISTAGNLAFPFSPSDLPAGEVYEFSVYHLMEQESPEAYPLEIQVFRDGRPQP